jgi:FkbM family methyltransferase
MRLYRMKQFAIATGLYEPIRTLRNAFDKGARCKTEEGLRFYSQFIKSSDLVFDIGANIGGKTELFSKLGAKVIAVEPHPKMFEILKARTRKYGARVHTLALGVGSSPGVATLYLGEHDGMASLSPTWSRRDHGSIQIEITTLDHLIDTYGCPDFLKIDIEGHEAEALKGLSRPIRRVSFEYHNDPVQLSQAADCVAILSKHQDMKMSLTSMEGHQFISDWLPAGDFAKRLPELTKGHGFGDIIAIA